MASVLQPSGHICQFRGGGGTDGDFSNNAENTLDWQNFGRVTDSIIFTAGSTMIAWATGTMQVLVALRPNDTSSPVTLRVRQRAPAVGGNGTVAASAAGSVSSGANTNFTLGPFSVTERDQLIVTVEPTSGLGFVRGCAVFVYV